MWRVAAESVDERLDFPSRFGGFIDRYSKNIIDQNE